MRLNTSKYEFEEKNPFKEDLLERKDFADTLSRIVDASDGRLILALNGEWGSGKTTFIEQWRALLTLDSYQTIYVNAWEHDYVSDPFLPIISSILSQISLPEGKILGATEALRKSGKFILRTCASFIETKIGDKATKEIKKEILNNSEYDILKDFQQYTEEIERFKDNLSTYASELVEETGKKLVIFVDELDRCKPNFAIAMMERIKHLFYVPNVVFVLAINNKVMEESVMGFYGCSDINAAAYLRRFFDVAVTLPEPKSIYPFIEHLYKTFEIDACIKNKQLHRDFNNVRNDILLTCRQCFPYTICSLRDLERFFALLRIVLCGVNLNSVHLYSLFAYTYLFLFEKTLYNDIKNHKFSIAECTKALRDLFLAKKTSNREYGSGTIAFMVNVIIGYARSVPNSPNCACESVFVEFSREMLAYSIDMDKCKTIFISSWNEMIGESVLDYFERIELSNFWGQFD